MKISVIQHHINTGVRGNCKSDPIALALIDAGCVQPYAGVTRLFWYDGDGEKHTAEITEQLYEFIRAFDQGEPVQPFEFELEESK